MSFELRYTTEANENLIRLSKNDPKAFQKALTLLAELQEHPRTGTVMRSNPLTLINYIRFINLLFIIQNFTKMKKYLYLVLAAAMLGLTACNSETPVTGISLSQQEMELMPGESKTLTATVLPSDADNPAITWTSSDVRIATVEQSGQVTAVAVGTCTVTCSSMDGSGVKAECVVTVSNGTNPNTQPANGQTYAVNGVSFTMIPVEGGTFQMGSTTGNDNEKPVHQVTVSSFSIGQTEVTQELWQAVMGSNPSYFSGSTRPVEMVSWNDCQMFITKLNLLTGKTFRLPTEAEWEYAARGGNKSKGYIYSGSNTIGDVAWYDDTSSSTTHDVATKSPNELGIYDMSGNVWEWCQDWYELNYYSSSPVNNPMGPTSGSDRVYRGGSWNYIATYCRVAKRSKETSTKTGNYLGFRLAQ